MILRWNGAPSSADERSVYQALARAQYNLERFALKRARKNAREQRQMSKQQSGGNLLHLYQRLDQPRGLVAARGGGPLSRAAHPALYIDMFNDTTSCATWQHDGRHEDSQSPNLVAKLY